MSEASAVSPAATVRRAPKRRVCGEVRPEPVMVTRWTQGAWERMRWVMERRWATVGETWRDTAEADDDDGMGGEAGEDVGADEEWEEGALEEEAIEREWEDRLARVEVEEEENGREAFGDG